MLAKSHLTMRAIFYFSNVSKCFDVSTKFQVHIICSFRKKNGGIFENFKFQFTFRLYFFDKIWTYFVKITLAN